MRVAAIAVLLASMGCAPVRETNDAVIVAIDALDDEELERRKLAADVLCASGRNAAYGLTLALADPEWQVRTKAQDGLVAIGLNEQVVRDGLRRCLQSPQASVRYDALHVIIRCDGYHADLLPDTLRSTRDPIVKVRVAAAGAYHRLTGEVEPVIEVLLSALRNAAGDRDWVARDWAAVFLGKMGGKARAALPVLRHARDRDPNRQVREVAERAIAAIADQ